MVLSSFLAVAMIALPVPRWFFPLVFDVPVEPTQDGLYRIAIKVHCTSVVRASLLLGDVPSVAGFI